MDLRIRCCDVQTTLFKPDRARIPILDWSSGKGRHCHDKSNNGYGCEAPRDGALSLLIAGDIGGTKAVLAIYHSDERVGALVVQNRNKSRLEGLEYRGCIFGGRHPTTSAAKID